MASVTAALDIGHDALKVVALRLREGIPEVQGFHVEPLNELGRVEDGPEKNLALRGRVVRLAAEQVKPGTPLVTGMSGRATILRYINVPPVPPWRLETLMRFETEEHRKGEECIYAYRLLDLPNLEEGLAVLLALTQDSVAEEHASLVAIAGDDDPDVNLTALGLFSAYLFGHGAEEGKTVLLLDIGAEEVNLAIARGDGLWFLRHQPGGGNRFTAALGEAFGLPWNDAERLKRGRFRMYPDPGQAPSEGEKKASEALTREAAALAGQIEASLLYCRAQTKLKEINPDLLLLSGGGSRLEGLAEFLGRRLRTSVERLQPFRKVSVGALPAERVRELEALSPSLAVPTGLALSRLLREAPRMDLRPTKARTGRVFRERGIFKRAAAAAFALGLVFWVTGAVRNYGRWRRQTGAAEKTLKEDKVLKGAHLTARDRYSRLFADLQALRDRVFSGEDFLRTLSQLKKRTPPPIMLVEVSTAKPRARGRAGKGEASTFQLERRVYVRGYARSRKSLPQAQREIKRFEESLAELGELFEQVEREYQTTVPIEKTGGYYVEAFVLALKLAERR